MQHRAGAICVGWPAELQALLCSTQNSSVSHVSYGRRMSCVIRRESHRGVLIVGSSKLKSENANRFLSLKCRGFFRPGVCPCLNHGFRVLYVVPVMKTSQAN